MSIKKISLTAITILFMLLLLIYPNESIKGAVKGLIMCSDIVIPSLFPFGVCALFLYNSGAFSSIERRLSSLSRFLFGINGRNFCVFIMSFLGGYPIGAILIENLYSNKLISKRNAENMLHFCVNSGPAFIIIAVGNGIFGNSKIGVLLFASNLLASIMLALLLKKLSVYEDSSKKTLKVQSLTDSFVESTAQASRSIISVCSFVILFSTIIGVIWALPIDERIKNLLCSFLEITNASLLTKQNVFLLSFLLGFGGFCIHFQILSVSKTLKPSYLKFFIGRIIHGLLCLVFSYILFKIFPTPIETVSYSGFIGKLSSISLPFSAALIFMCATFLLSINNRGRKI